MKRMRTFGLRAAGFFALALTIAQCGDSSVHVNTGVDPDPGTFNGFTDEGGAITIDVDSIRRITFECDDDTIENTFSPTEPIKGGHFDVSFTDAGRKFRVKGTFTSNDNLVGTIDDADDHCDVDFDAVRGVTGRTPTPARTPTP